MATAVFDVVAHEVDTARGARYDHLAVGTVSVDEGVDCLLIEGKAGFENVGVAAVEFNEAFDERF